MSKQENSITLNCVNSKELINFILKFKELDTSCLLEIDKDNITIKSCDPNRHGIKYGKLDFNSIFRLDDDVELPENLFVGIYSTENFKTVLETMSDSSLRFQLFYTEETHNISFMNQNEEVVTNYVYSLKLATDKMSVDIPMGEFGEFSYVSDKVVSLLFTPDEFKFKFDLTKNTLKQVESLSSIGGTDGIVFEPKTKWVNILGRDFKIKNEDSVEINELGSVTLDKRKFKYLDKSDYTVYAISSGCLFKGPDGVDVVISELSDEDED